MKNRIIFLIIFLIPVIGFSKKHVPMDQELVLSLVHDKIPDFKMIPVTAFTKEALKATKKKPNKVIGDFNGDGLKDLSLYGYSKKKKKTFILVGLSGKKPRVVTLESAKFKGIPRLQDWDVYLSVGVQKKYEGKVQDLLQIESKIGAHYNVESYYYSHSKRKMKLFKRKID